MPKARPSLKKYPRLGTLPVDVLDLRAEPFRRARILATLLGAALAATLGAAPARAQTPPQSPPSAQPSSSAQSASAASASSAQPPASQAQPSSSAPASLSQAISEGARLFLEADFESSRAAFEQALESSSLRREDAVEAHRYLAALALIHGDRATAQTQARMAVALQAEVDVPEGAPEELGQIFQEASQELGGVASLDLQLTPDGPSGRPAAQLTLRRAPDGLLSGLRLSCEAEAWSDTSAGEPPELGLSVPSGTTGTLRCEGSAVTTAGASLLLSQGTLELGSPIIGGGDGDLLLIGILAGATVLVAVVVGIAVGVVSSESDGAQITGARVVGWEGP